MDSIRSRRKSPWTRAIRQTRSGFSACTQFAPHQIKDFYKKATVIYHDAECAPYRSGVHAHFDELADLDPETKAKMQLSHYQDVVMDDWQQWQDKARAAGFQGFVPKGHVVEF